MYLPPMYTLYTSTTDYIIILYYNILAQFILMLTIDFPVELFRSLGSHQRAPLYHIYYFIVITIIYNNYYYYDDYTTGLGILATFYNVYYIALIILLMYMSMILHIPTIRINDDAAGLRWYAFDLPAACTMQVLKNRIVRPQTVHERHIICILYYIILLCSILTIIIILNGQ